MSDCVVGPYVNVPTDDDLRETTSTVASHAGFVRNIMSQIINKFKHLNVLDVIQWDRTLKPVLTDITQHAESMGPFAHSLPVPLHNSESAADCQPFEQSEVADEVIPGGPRFGSITATPGYDHMRYGLDTSTRVMSMDCGELNDDPIADIYDIGPAQVRRVMDNLRRTVESRKRTVTTENYETGSRGSYGKSKRRDEETAVPSDASTSYDRHYQLLQTRYDNVSEEEGDVVDFTSILNADPKTQT